MSDIPEKPAEKPAEQSVEKPETQEPPDDKKYHLVYITMKGEDVGLKHMSSKSLESIHAKLVELAAHGGGYARIIHGVECPITRPRISIGVIDGKLIEPAQGEPAIADDGEVPSVSIDSGE